MTPKSGQTNRFQPLGLGGAFYHFGCGERLLINLLPKWQKATTNAINENCRAVHSLPNNTSSSCSFSSNSLSLSSFLAGFLFITIKHMYYYRKKGLYKVRRDKAILKDVNKTSISWPSIIVLSAHYFNINSLSKPGNSALCFLHKGSLFHAWWVTKLGRWVVGLVDSNTVPRWGHKPVLCLYQEPWLANKMNTLVLMVRYLIVVCLFITLLNYLADCMCDGWTSGLTNLWTHGWFLKTLDVGPIRDIGVAH